MPKGNSQVIVRLGTAGFQHLNFGGRFRDGCINGTGAFVVRIMQGIRASIFTSTNSEAGSGHAPTFARQRFCKQKAISSDVHFGRNSYNSQAMALPLVAVADEWGVAHGRYGIWTDTTHAGSPERTVSRSSYGVMI